MHIRTATMEDLDEIARVEAECFPAAEAHCICLDSGKIFVYCILQYGVDFLGKLTYNLNRKKSKHGNK